MKDFSMSQGEVRIETLDADLGVVRVTIDRAPVNAMGLHLYQELACPSSEQSGRFEAVANGGFGASGLSV
jgi:hypothetical protein